MSFALSTTVAQAIDSYDDLVAAVRDWVDNAQLDQAVIDRAIRLAEAHFNRVLRSPAMETIATVTVNAGGLATLPLDFLAMRSLRQTDGTARTLVEMTISSLMDRYGTCAGIPAAYAKQGSQLRFAPVGTATLAMVYYAKLPALTSQTQSNWLLEAHPDAYLARTVLNVYLRDGDGDNAARAAAIADQLEGSIISADTRSRYGSEPLIPRGIPQVRGARA